jgi:hypothetical protein
MNGDGKFDLYKYDTNNDGRPDTVYRDLNHDGRFELLEQDRNDDGRPDRYAYQLDDKQWDLAREDNNFDGDFETTTATRSPEAAQRGRLGGLLRARMIGGWPPECVAPWHWLS